MSEACSAHKRNPQQRRVERSRAGDVHPASGVHMPHHTEQDARRHSPPSPPRACWRRRATCLAFLRCKYGCVSASLTHEQASFLLPHASTCTRSCSHTHTHARTRARAPQRSGRAAESTARSSHTLFTAETCGQSLTFIK